MELVHLLHLLLSALLLLQALARRPLLEALFPMRRLLAGRFFARVPAFPAPVSHAGLADLLEAGEVGEPAAVEAAAHR